MAPEAEKGAAATLNACLILGGGIAEFQALCPGRKAKRRKSKVYLDINLGRSLVELRGIEPLTSAVRLQRSPI